MQVGATGFARLRMRQRAELRLERERRAVGRLEPRREGCARTFAALGDAFDRQRLAVRRVEDEACAVDVQVERLQLQWDAVQALRQRVAGDRQRSSLRVDGDARADVDRAQVERTRHCRHDDRQAERRACARTRQVHAAAEKQRVRARPGTDRSRCRSRSALRTRPPAPALRDTAATLASIPSNPGGRCTAQRLQVLVLVCARERHAQRAKRAGLVVGSSCEERRMELRRGTAAELKRFT